MHRKRPARKQRGAVMVEFIVAILPFSLLFTGVIQLAMISVAKLTVHYAAACAARAAVVVIPEEEEGGHDAGNERIRNAALWALLPIASSGAGSQSITDAFAKGGGYSEVSRSTGVLLDQSRLGGDGYDAQITTRVVYAYHCTIPLASRFFCSTIGELPEAAQKDLHAANITPGAGRFLVLRAQHTLTKQGRPNPAVNPRRPL
jgi:Flp pilus assembly protein TadG